MDFQSHCAGTGVRRVCRDGSRGWNAFSYWVLTVDYSRKQFPNYDRGKPDVIAYVTVGANDIARAERFYSAFLPALGYELEYYHGDLSYALPVEQGRSPVSPDFYVKAPFNGQPATTGNGNMVAFEARNQAQVRELHAAALAAGGADEGAPGFRDAYGPNFYVSYLRDPDGNKVALFSSNPDDPGRDG